MAASVTLTITLFGLFYLSISLVPLVNANTTECVHVSQFGVSLLTSLMKQFLNLTLLLLFHL